MSTHVGSEGKYHSLVTWFEGFNTELRVREIGALGCQILDTEVMVDCDPLE